MEQPKETFYIGKENLLSTWFTSDTHLGHKNILSLGEGRPFEAIENHDQTILDNWNNLVKPDDI